MAPGHVTGHGAAKHASTIDELVSSVVRDIHHLLWRFHCARDSGKPQLSPIDHDNGPSARSSSAKPVPDVFIVYLQSLSFRAILLISLVVFHKPMHQCSFLSSPQLCKRLFSRFFGFD
jgi:hypothetical protein